MAKHRKAGGLPTLKRQYHEPKFLRDEKRTIEERLSEKLRRLENQAVEIRNRPNQNQPQIDCFPDWQFTEARNFEVGLFPQDENQPSTSQARPIAFCTTDETPMEEEGISRDSKLAPSVLEVPTINWANYLGVKSVQ